MSKTRTIDIGKIALGLGSFALGTIAIAAAAVLGDSYARGRKPATPDEGEGASASGQPAATAAPEAPIAPQAPEAPSAPVAPSAPTGPTGGDAEHAAPDLEREDRPGAHDRAPDAFRPDPTAPVPDSEREGLRPATGPAPTLVSGRSNDRI